MVRAPIGVWITKKDPALRRGQSREGARRRDKYNIKNEAILRPPNMSGGRYGSGIPERRQFVEKSSTPLLYPLRDYGDGDHLGALSVDDDSFGRF